jgi:hypothetical protein
MATPSAIALVLRRCFFKGIPPYKQGIGFAAPVTDTAWLLNAPIL